MRKYLMLIVAMCSGMCSYAQGNINMIEILNIEQDIVSLENRITSSIKINNPDIANIQGLQQFHILWLGTRTNRKEDFLNYSFLYQLDCGYYNLSPKVKKIKSGKPSLLYRISPDLYYYIGSKKWKKYLKTSTLITDSVGNLVATGDARFVTSLHNDSFAQYDMKLAKMFFNKEIDFAFYLHSMRYMVGVKGNHLYALKDTQEGLKIYSWEEFISCCFDEWVYPGRKRE